MASVPLGAAHAQSTDTPQLPTPAPGTTKGGDVESRRADASQAQQELSPEQLAINRLVLKGWATPVPTFNDTVDQDVREWRSKLAAAGFGFVIFSTNLSVYDFAQAGGGIPGAQLYNGQRYTYQTGNQTPVLTYDLGHLIPALKDGQIGVVGAGSVNGYQARDGIRSFRLKELQWYQPIYNGKVEMELGILADQQDYMGTAVGGSFAGGTLGPQASLPVEAGLSYGQYGTPTFSARVNYTKRFYTRTGLVRSISPKGATAEYNNNVTGFAFTVPGAKLLVIHEFGYKKVATPGGKSLWFRAGGFYNFSQYTSVVSKTTQSNHFVYGSLDRQLTQAGGIHPERGLYAGATFNAVPGNVNAISRYYEGRTYYRGLQESRPNDMFSFVAAINSYGGDAQRANTTTTFKPFATTQSYTGSYSFRIVPGFYVQPGLSVVKHPVYNRNIGTAVNGLLNIVGFF